MPEKGRYVNPSAVHCRLGTSARVHLATALEAAAGALLRAAYEIVRPKYDGPLCPDCQLGPDVGDNCPICEASFEEQKRSEAIYASGYEDGARFVDDED